jgi:hypothetical protein
VEDGSARCAIEARRGKIKTPPHEVELRLCRLTLQRCQVGGSARGLLVLGRSGSIALEARPSRRPGNGLARLGPLRGNDPSRALRPARAERSPAAPGWLASVSAPLFGLARRRLSVRRTCLAPCPLVSIVRAIEVLMQAKRHSPPKLVRRCGPRRLGGKPAKAGSSTIVPARLRRVPQAPPAALRARRRGNWPPPDQHKDQSHGYHRISHEA